MTLGVFSCSPAYAWDIDKMNQHVDQTNFIVGGNCTGTLIDIENRYILTNNHCIDNYFKTTTKEIVNEEGEVTKVQIQRTKNVEVSQNVYRNHETLGFNTWVTEIIERDKDLDLAILQIKADVIPQKESTTIYKGDYLQRGEVVYAVGNPLGLDATITKGIISSTSRRLVLTSLDGNDYFQIDPGIAPGNSGGALYNDSGDLIGIPSAGVGGYGHIGFAIPFYVIQEWMEDNNLVEKTDEKDSVTNNTTNFVLQSD